MKLLLTLPTLILVNILYTAVMSTPVWLLWTVFGLGTRMFGFLPPAWQSVSLPEVIGLFLLVTAVRLAVSSISAEFKQ